MSLDTALRHLTRDPREWVHTGLVAKFEDSDAFGLLLIVELVDGRKVQARPAHVGTGDGSGLYCPYSVGDEVLLVVPGGDINAAVALATKPTSKPQRPETAYENDRVRITHPEAVEVRGTGDDAVHGVLLRPLLDDLATLVQALQSLVTAITGTVIVPQDGGAAIKAAVVAAATASITSDLATVLANLNTSKAGTGGAPHCSPILRATDEG